MHRIGIVALLHESNTFIQSPTTLEHFQADVAVHGAKLFDIFGGSHHEIGGFLDALGWHPNQYSGSPHNQTTINSATWINEETQVEIVPIAAYRATPCGIITSESWESIVKELLEHVRQAMLLDGVLVAAHGAAVSENARDADGNWLARLRALLGKDIPIVATLDPHANLSQEMVNACDALIAYRTNPHLDQHARGVEAAQLMLGILKRQVRPKMVAKLLPMVINIERQSTDEPHLKTIYDLADLQRKDPRILTNSILLGFPYADVAEMGAAVLTVANDQEELAAVAADQLGNALWNAREQMEGVLISLPEAMEQVAKDPDPSQRYCLLDMGDNVGGGSAADGTWIAMALAERKLGPSVVCIYDPQVVQECRAAGVGASIPLRIGGKTDQQHGPVWECNASILSLHEGKFREDRPRHGGITEFDQGPSVVLKCIDSPITILVTSKRMVPFSLHQLISCGLDPTAFRILVAKGVHAPLAAYREVCQRFLRVNTPGSTCADIHQLHYAHRRHPLFPFERDFDPNTP